MKRAKQMQALARQRYERQILKGLNDLDNGRVVSDEEAMMPKCANATAPSTTCNA